MKYAKIKNDLEADKLIEELKNLEEEEKGLRKLYDEKIDRYNEFKEEDINSIRIKQNGIFNALMNYAKLCRKNNKMQSSYSEASVKLIIKQQIEKMKKNNKAT